MSGCYSLGLRPTSDILFTTHLRMIIQSITRGVEMKGRLDTSTHCQTWKNNRLRDAVSSPVSKFHVARKWCPGHLHKYQSLMCVIRETALTQRRLLVWTHQIFQVYPSDVYHPVQSIISVSIIVRQFSTIHEDLMLKWKIVALLTREWGSPRDLSNSFRIQYFIISNSTWWTVWP